MRKNVLSCLWLSIPVLLLGIAQTQATGQNVSTRADNLNFRPPTTSPLMPKVTNPANWIVPSAGGRVVVLPSSIPAAKQGTTAKTIQAHTNLQLFVPAGWNASTVEPPRPNIQPYSDMGFYETPASIACDYGLVTVASACNPNLVSTLPTGGSQSIAIVDAYDNPLIGPDLAYFSAEFGIPFSASQLVVVYQGGTVPPPGYGYSNDGWALEEDLDVEYAHAMAPAAKIYLVEAQSSYLSDLSDAVMIANNLIRCGNSTDSATACPTTATGKGEISMSWGGGEWSGETSLDSSFTAPNVVSFAAAGDGPGTIYPCTSPNVVCVGGTATRRDPVNGALAGHAAWDLTGGGVSPYETRPSYQSSITARSGNFRGVPDVAADADPETGVWVWSSEDFLTCPGCGLDASYGWWIVGGTSASTPIWAGIVNRAGGFSASTNAELTKVYTNRSNTAMYRDAVYGFCGPQAGYTAITGWDPCTGVGTPVGYGGK